MQRLCEKMMVALHWQNCVLTLDIIVRLPWLDRVTIVTETPNGVRIVIEATGQVSKLGSPLLIAQPRSPICQNWSHGYQPWVNPWFRSLILDLDPGRQCPASQSKDGWSLNWSRSLDPTTTNSPWSSSAQRRRSWGQRLMTFLHWWHFDWKTKVRQKRVQNWVIHPMSQFRWTIFNLKTLSFFPTLNS